MLLTSQRRGVLSAAMVEQFLADLAILPKQIEHQEPDRVHGAVLALAKKHRLTSHDACYLEVAKRMALPLATLDADLKAAAKKGSVLLFAPV